MWSRVEQSQLQDFQGIWWMWMEWLQMLSKWESQRGKLQFRERLIRYPNTTNFPWLWIVYPQPSNPVAECDVDSICVPDADCLVQPDGNGLLEARSSICSGTETCCPRRQIRKTVTSPCQEIGGQCVPQGQCSSVFSVDIRITTCDEPGFECCMESPATTASTPFLGKVCAV